MQRLVKSTKSWLTRDGSVRINSEKNRNTFFDKLIALTERSANQSIIRSKRGRHLRARHLMHPNLFSSSFVVGEIRIAGGNLLQQNQVFLDRKMCMGKRSACYKIYTIKWWRIIRREMTAHSGSDVSEPDRHTSNLMTPPVVFFAPHEVWNVIWFGAYPFTHMKGRPA